jgi:hypothetical protein
MYALELMKMKKGQKFVFWIFFVSLVIMTYCFVSEVIEQLASYLGIYCFSLQKRERQVPGNA